MLEAISDAAWTNMLYTELATVRVRTDPAFYETKIGWQYCIHTTGNHPLCPSVNIIRESNNYDQENQMPDGLDSCDDKALVKSLG